MESQGFIKVYRKMLEWEWFTEPNTSHLFMYLLLSANYTPQRWQGNVIQRGQLLTNLKKIQDDTGISRQSVRTCLKRLEKTGEITVESTNKYSVITICNYDNYQYPPNIDNNQPTLDEQINIIPPASDQHSISTQSTSKKQTTNTQPTTDQYSTNTQSALYKEYKEYKDNTKKEKDLLKKCENTARAYTHDTHTRDTPVHVIAEPAETFPYREIADGWNSVCRSLPKIVSLSQKRKNEIKSRCTEWKKQLQRDDYTKVADELFHKIEQSDFLTGRSGKSWKADFDWVFKNDTNWLKVWEGNYSNHGITVGMNVPLRDGSEFEGSEDDFLNFNIKP